jgi:hypothetical protein
MKVLFKNMVNGFTGKADGSVIYYSRRLNRCFVRRRPIYKDHPRHQPWKEIMKNLGRIQPSDGYKDDLTWYLELYNQLKQNKFTPVHSWNNLFIKLLFAMAKQYPDIDLSTITRDDIISRELPCMSVNRAIDAGLLPEVKNYVRFTNEL